MLCFSSKIYAFRLSSETGSCCGEISSFLAILNQVWPLWREIAYHSAIRCCFPILAILGTCVSTRTWKFPVCISFSPIYEWVPEYIWGCSYLCLGSSFHFLMILLDVVFWRVTLSPLRPIVSNFILSLHHPSTTINIITHHHSGAAVVTSSPYHYYS